MGYGHRTGINLWNIPLALNRLDNVKYHWRASTPRWRRVWAIVIDNWQSIVSSPFLADRARYHPHFC